MKKILALLLVLAVVVPVMAETENKNVEVEWNLAGCWISLNVSPYYRIAPPGGTTYNVWEPNQTITGENPHELEVKTSCKGYNVYVKTTGLTVPAGHKSEWNPEDTYTDFDLKADVTTGNISSMIPDYESFNSLNTDKQILETEQARNTFTDMYYRYNIDENDVPGQYTMNLVYTVSTD